jgi:hypothetical protein
MGRLVLVVRHCEARSNLIKKALKTPWVWLLRMAKNIKKKKHGIIITLY